MLLSNCLLFKIVFSFIGVGIKIFLAVAMGIENMNIIELHFLTEEEDIKDDISEEILKMIEQHGMTDEQLTFEVEEEIDSPEDVALFIESSRGKTILQFNNHRYRRGYRSKHGTRWICSINKNCSAFVYVNDNNEIIMSNQEHCHPSSMVVNADAKQNETAVVITSRKGKEMLLFRQYTYRKQYFKNERARWVCSTLKNCRACVFTDASNIITSCFEEHCHDPPKYYLKPNNVLEALREPVIIETD